MGNKKKSNPPNLSNIKAENSEYCTYRIIKVVHAFLCPPFLSFLPFTIQTPDPQLASKLCPPLPAALWCPGYPLTNQMESSASTPSTAPAPGQANR